MRGRKPKPLEQKLREGNAGNRPLPEPIDLGRDAELEPPDLPVPALDLWNEIVPQLRAAGILHRVDRAALVALCLQWDNAVLARETIEEQGIFARGSMGQTVEHPAVGVERAAHTMFLRFAEQYGLTPSARARIAAAVAGAPPGLDEELAEVIDLTPELRAVEG